jgi:hypothetical protein
MWHRAGSEVERKLPLPVLVFSEPAQSAMQVRATRVREHRYIVDALQRRRRAAGMIRS